MQVASTEKSKEWRDMLDRYDIVNVKVFHKVIKESDYILVFHEVGPTFPEKMQEWENSQHPFDQWFNKQIKSMAGDIGPETASAMPIVDFQ
ncbi:hypothetical protein [Piscirickettsia salmonis]|uniref:hypothetical protein n=1 Tax=Piscirickettsia salmonis TaxID=1238 RepID=UPI003A80548D